MRLKSIEKIKHQYEHVYVSPHMDDIALSCGGRIVNQRKKGENVLIVTVFTGDIDEAKKPRRKLFNQFINTQERRAEDTGAMDRLGVDYLWLDYPEAIYRGKRPLSLFSSNVYGSGTEKPVCDAIFTDLQKTCNTAQNKILYLPLGMGKHIDHQIIFQISAQLLSLGNQDFEFIYYEEVPYMFIPNLLKYRMKGIGIEVGAMESTKDITHKKPIMQETIEVYRSIVDLPFVKLNNPLKKGVVFLLIAFYLTFLRYMSNPRRGALRGRNVSPEISDVSSCIDEKLDAILNYRSQIKLFFGNNDKEAIKNLYEKYSETIGGATGKFLERYWKIRE
ncbi:PIG-L family deacetylase [Desulfobacterota bacterium AH_259_B03_O07]|nr:PIG-L family deacetylase [Desulfobacterota bacterium AH_259_B03_O07]